MRTSQDHCTLTFPIQRDRRDPLWTQVYQGIVERVRSGHLDNTTPMPSTRALAHSLGVSRTTVVAAYDKLVDDGVLAARRRSAYFVTRTRHDIDPIVQRLDNDIVDADCSDEAWSSRLRQDVLAQRNITKPEHWYRYEYPFIYGQPDEHAFPLDEWRQCMSDAQSRTFAREWMFDTVDGDCGLLKEYIREHVLPRRGIYVGNDDILITLGAQHALYLLGTLLIRPGTRVGFEEPGYPDARNMLCAFGASVEPVHVDDDGANVDASTSGLEFLYVTPSHQVPTGITMSEARREQVIDASRKNGFLIIEDDYDSEMNFVASRTPALRALDANRIIYVGSLSKTMFPGLRIGYVVAPRPCMKALMALRRLMVRQPPRIMSVAMGLFFQRGYYDAYIRLLHQRLGRKWSCMERGIHQYIPTTACRITSGGTAFWLRARRPDNLESALHDLASSGVLIEDGDPFFMRDPGARFFFRLGFMSIDEDRITEGLRRIGLTLESHGMLP